MLKKVRETIQNYRMLESDRPIIAGVSGGPDSMALLDVLLNLVPNPIIAVHLNHQFRGKDAEEDAEFVRAECLKKAIPVVIRTFNVPAYMEETGLGAHDAARKIRYQILLEEAEKWNSDRIALGHHANDQAETILMRILRGSGVHGLAGIPYTRDMDQVKVVRPLLDVTRKEIENYCQIRSIPYRTDLSNLSTKYFRNEIRLEVIPYLMKYNQNLVAHLHQLGRMIRDEDHYLNREAELLLKEHLIESKDQTYTLNVLTLQRLDIALQRRMIHLILKYLNLKQEVTYTHIDGIIKLIDHEHPSKSVDLPGARIYRNYDQLVFTTDRSVKNLTYQVELTIPSETILPFTKQKVKAFILDFYKKQEGIWAVFDYDRLEGKLLMIRTRNQGDRIQIHGLNGSKKVKDLFIDQKIPKGLRDQYPILSAEEMILWIPGIARSKHALIEENTQSFLYVIVEE